MLCQRRLNGSQADAKQRDGNKSRQTDGIQCNCQKYRNVASYWHPGQLQRGLSLALSEPVHACSPLAAVNTPPGRMNKARRAKASQSDSLSKLELHTWNSWISPWSSSS